MKKGFTLVELLAIIVVIGILGTIGIAVTTNVQKETKRNLYKEQLNQIETTLRRYISENEGRTVNINGNRVKLDIFKSNTFEIPISFLVNEEYLEKTPINVTCGKELTGSLKVTVTNPSTGTYTVTYQMSNTEETYCK